MSFYRRFISYMYDISDTAKRKNCGFVKVEVRGNKCTFLFQFKNASCQGNCKIYLCQRGGDPEYILLKELLITDGSTCYKIDIHSQKLANHSLCFEQCCGILCRNEKGHQCETCWDESGVLPEYKKPQEIASVPETREMVPIPETQEIISIPKAQEMISIPETQEKFPVPATQEAFSISETQEIKKEIEKTIEKEVEEKIEKTIEEETLPSTGPETTLPEHRLEITTENHTLNETSSESDTANDSPSSSPKTFPEVWEHLQKEFSPMDPFEDDAIVETIKITPSDLGYLQSFNLNLGSNQFLLHGYKSYHHLLLGRLHGQNQYILGIPGIYDPQEQFMAKMFGFPCFKPIRECRQKKGQFGYWMKCFR